MRWSRPPRSAPGSASSSSATDPLAGGREAPRGREEARVRDHPVVGPHAAGLDVPAAAQQLEALREAPAIADEGPPELRGLVDRRQVAAQDPARSQRLEG